MSKESRETKPAVRRPAEIQSRRLPDIETVFQRMLDDPWFRPFARPWRELWRPNGFVLEAPAVDMFEEKEDLVVKAEIPGLAKEDIDVSVTGNMLTIKGQKKKDAEIKEKDYYRCERTFGSFARTFELPVEVKSNDVKASFKNGVLEIRLPKNAKSQKNSVHIKVA
jgi:HSP20 family protein